ncbi:MAG TPA: hypothetical protein VFA98_08260 [Thermoanaerobaculia bacterium]|nr:hypothetical protein [Thermoanaerobaculia bacterium]
MEPITLILLGAGGYYVWKKNENPEWSPLAWLTSTPHDKHLALERVKVASVPTPAPTAALDPGMSTDQVKQVNHSLTSETDHEVIKAQADALGSLGHASSAAALDAKAKAVGEAKAHGASDAEIQGKQFEAQAPAAVGWGMPGYPFGGDPSFSPSYHPEVTGADAVFGTHSYGYPWSEVSYGHSYHPEHVTGIQSGPAIVGIQSGPAIVGIQSGPAIVGWDLFAHGVPAGGGARPGWGQPVQHPQHPQHPHHQDWGRHGRYLHPAHERAREQWGRPRRHEWEQWRHHRRFRRPEEMVVEEDFDTDLEPEQEPEVIEEIVPQPEEHHHRHHEAPAPPPPPPPQVSITPGTITNGEFPPIEWPEEFVGVAQYGGGGLVAEFPGVPQQAQPYGPPVGQYGQQYVQPYVQQPQYGEDLFQEYAQAIEPQLEAYYQQPQYYYQQQQQPEYYRRRAYHRPWGGGGYRRYRRW